MEIYVIRHTPVKVSKSTCYGRLDIPLADSFNDDVEIYKDKLEGEFDAVYSSPSFRCVALARALGYDNIHTNTVFPKPSLKCVALARALGYDNVHLDEKLFEINFGEWEGKTWNNIDQDELNVWMEDFVNNVPGGGESLAQMFDRVSEFIERLRNEKYEKVLIISHAGVIRCLWAYLLHMPLNNIFKIPVGFHELFVFRLGSLPKLDSIIKIQ